MFNIGLFPFTKPITWISSHNLSFFMIHNKPRVTAVVNTSKTIRLKALVLPKEVRDQLAPNLVTTESFHSRVSLLNNHNS